MDEPDCVNSKEKCCSCFHFWYNHTVTNWIYEVNRSISISMIKHEAEQVCDYKLYDHWPNIS